MESLNEFSVIKEFFSDFSCGKATVIGPGDDCAVLRLPKDTELATSSDTLIEGCHFPFGSSGDDVAYRAIATSASDLAAMGAQPLACVMSLSLPEVDIAWLEDFKQGLSSAIRCFSLPLVGGDLTRGPLTITVTVYGSLPLGRCLLRSGAKQGEIVLVTGTLGDAAAGLAFLNNEWEPSCDDREFLVRRFFRPESRLDLAASLLEVATSSIDISDGLLADAGHIASESGLSIQIDVKKIPFSPVLSKLDNKQQVLKWALSGGDDYELCFTMPANKNTPPGCTPIGFTAPGAGVRCDHFDSISSEVGYRHF